MSHKLAEDLFNQVYAKLNTKYEGIVPREDMHQAVYTEIVEQCAIIASAYSPNHVDIGEIIRTTMGLNK